jgi:hypothetical protein
VSEPRSARTVVPPDGAPHWVNWAGNQEVYPKQILRPETLGELRQIVAEVTARKGRLRAVATGLSFSDILQTDDTLVVLTDLKVAGEPGVLLPIEEDLLRPHDAPFVRVVCGARIREVNRALARAGLACVNLGGFDGQTLIGAVSTSTHGSGIKLGPLPSLVRSLDLVTTGGKMYRIEPSAGPTNPERFKSRNGNDRTLVQRDDWFQTVVVSMGCTGVIHSILMEVTAAYRLSERRYLRTLSSLRTDIAFQLAAHRHFEISINPYRRQDGDYTCLVTERDIAPADVARVPVTQERRRTEDIAFLPSTEQELIRIMSTQPRLIPAILETSMGALVTSTRHIDESYRIFNLNKINDVEVLSGEYFFPLANDVYLKALDRFLWMVEHNRKHGICQTAPISLRFVEASSSYLSMAQGQRYCTMEIPVYKAVPGALETLLTYEQVCYEYQGRPHWGQIHELSGARGWMDAAYPMAASWKKVYAELNDQGVFDNHFTDRMGISVGGRR